MKKQTFAIVAAVAMLVLLLSCWIFSGDAGKPEDKAQQGGGSREPAATNAAPVAGRATPAPPPNVATNYDAAAENAVSSNALRVTGCNAGYNGDMAYVSLHFTDAITLEGIREHVKVTPEVKNISFANDDNYSDWYYSHFGRKSVRIYGDFECGKKYTVRLAPGKVLDSDRSHNYIEKEIVRTFTFEDMPVDIALASASARYLPPIGNWSLPVNTRNVEGIECSVARVLDCNVVYFIARDNQVYESYYWEGRAPDDIARKLTSAKVEWAIPFTNSVKNVKEPYRIKLRGEEGGITQNGIYLVDVRSKNSSGSSGRHERPGFARLICVTDIGISARVIPAGKGGSGAGGELAVWTTSLTTGKPMQHLKVTAYAKNGDTLAAGMVNSSGFVKLDLPAGSEKDPLAVVAALPDNSDYSYLPIMQHTFGDTNPNFGKIAERGFVEDGKFSAFVWTERGIYRFGDPIMVHAVVRDANGKAPASLESFPLEVVLKDPAQGKVHHKAVAKLDSCGGVLVELPPVEEGMPSGGWGIELRVPDGDALGRRVVAIEDFVPPQIRVALKNAPEEVLLTGENGVSLDIEAEYLFGAPAEGLDAQVRCVTRDAPFKAGDHWKGYKFGNDNLMPVSNDRTFARRTIAGDGVTSFSASERGIFLKSDDESRSTADIWPRAAVSYNVAGTVFQAGGRTVTDSATVTLHKYPCYIGVDAPETRVGAPVSFGVALVSWDRKPISKETDVEVKLCTASWIYGYTCENGLYKWHSDRIVTPVRTFTNRVAFLEGKASMAMAPFDVASNYMIELRDLGSHSSVSAEFYVSSAAGGEVSSNLGNPSKVEIVADKKAYDAGDTPAITVKAPFAGEALLTVQRDKFIEVRRVTLTNATSEIRLPVIRKDWAPNIEATVSVIQPIIAGKTWCAQRATGSVVIPVNRGDDALKVSVAASVAYDNPRTSGSADKVVSTGADVTATVEVEGVGENEAAFAVITLVDEGVNALTDEAMPDPLAFFNGLCGSGMKIYDVFSWLLPVAEPDDVVAAATKIGGGDKMFSRMAMALVNPIKARRFMPLSKWSKKLPVVNGKAQAKFELPEFSGQIRVTAVAYTARAAGAAMEKMRVAPAIVSQPDMPRVLAPNDSSFVTVTLHNNSNIVAEVDVKIACHGALPSNVETRTVRVAPNKSENVMIPMKAGVDVGVGRVDVTAKGLGETHIEKFEIPVRPAASQETSSKFAILKPGEEFSMAGIGDGMLQSTVSTSVSCGDSPIARLLPALEYLVTYPYGCLEQVTSGVYPLIAAGSVLSTIPASESTIARESDEFLLDGIKRINSMAMRGWGYYNTWPNVDCRASVELCLYAAQATFEAQKVLGNVPEDALEFARSVVRQVRMDGVSSTNANMLAYACLVEAVAGNLDANNLFTLRERPEGLSDIGRARLARACAMAGYKGMALDLLKEIQIGGDLLTLSEALIAILEIDPANADVPEYVSRIMKLATFDGQWGTTFENAHALLALGAYYRVFPPKASGTPRLNVAIDGAPKGGVDIASGKEHSLCGQGRLSIKNTGDGDAMVAIQVRGVPVAKKPRPAVSSGISIERKLYDFSGKEVDHGAVKRGDLIVVNNRVTNPTGAKAMYDNAVLVDLLPACFEAEDGDTAIPGDVLAAITYANTVSNWILRKDVLDDRVVAFSRDWLGLGSKQGVNFTYVVRVVSAGEYELPAPAIEKMYQPSVRATGESGLRIRVAK